MNELFLIEKLGVLRTVDFVLVLAGVNLVVHCFVDPIGDIGLQHSQWLLMMTVVRLRIFWISRGIEEVFLDWFHVGSTRIAPLCLARLIALLGAHHTPPLLYGFQVWFIGKLRGGGWRIRSNRNHFRFGSSILLIFIWRVVILRISNESRLNFRNRPGIAVQRCFIWNFVLIDPEGTLGLFH